MCRGRERRQLLAQRLPRATQSGHDRTNRQRQNLRHFTAGESFNDAQQQHGPMLQRQRVERLVYFELLDHGRARVRLVLERNQGRRRFPRSPIKRIDQDAIKPRSRAGAIPELMETSPRLEQSLLHQVLCRRRIARKSQRKAQQARRLRHHDAFEITFGLKHVPAAIISPLPACCRHRMLTEPPCVKHADRCKHLR